MSTISRLARYTSANIAHGGFTFLSITITSGLLYRMLGSDFGVFALVTASMTKLNIIEDSLGTYFIVLIARRQKGDIEKNKFSACLFLYGFLTAIAGLIYGVAIYFLLIERLDSIYIAWFSAVGIWLAWNATMGSKILEGFEDYFFLRVSQSTINLLRLMIFVIFFLLNQHSLHLYLILHVASYIFLLFFFFLRARLGHSFRLSREIGAFGISDCKDILRFARPLLFSRTMNVLSSRLDLWIVQAFAGASAMAAYAIAETVVQVVMMSMELMKVILPVSISRWQPNNQEWIQDFVLGTSKAATLIAGGICVILLASLEPMLKIWFGSTPELTLTVVRFLVISLALNTFMVAGTLIMIGQNHFRNMESNYIMAAILNSVISFGVTIYLAPWGPALGNAVAGLALLVWNTRSIEKWLGLPNGIMGRKIYWPCILLFSTSIVLGSLVPERDTVIWSLLCRGSVAIILFAFMFWLLIFNGQERNLLKAYLPWKK